MRASCVCGASRSQGGAASFNCQTAADASSLSWVFFLSSSYSSSSPGGILYTYLLRLLRQPSCRSSSGLLAWPPLFLKFLSFAVLSFSLLIRNRKKKKKKPNRKASEYFFFFKLANEYWYLFVINLNWNVFSNKAANENRTNDICITNITVY